MAYLAMHRALISRAYIRRQPTPFLITDEAT
jgi:hypothetical protein